MGFRGKLEWGQLLAVVVCCMVVLLGGHSGRTLHLDTVMDIFFLYGPAWALQTQSNDAGRNHPFVVIGVDAHVVVLEIEGVLAELDMFELVFVEVWPAPQPSVYDMRKAFSSCHLQPAVQCPLDCHTLAGVDSVSGDGCYERVQLIFLLLQLLYQAFNGTLSKTLILPALPVAHQAVNDA